MRILSKTILIGLCALLATPAFAADKPQTMKLPPVAVEVAKAKQVTHQEAITATGSLAAFQGIVVRPEIAGHISKIYFKSGEFVQANTPLIEINPDVYKAQLTQAQARLVLAKMAYARALKLTRTHFISKADFDQATENMKVEHGEVNELQAKLNQTLIRAPFSGKLGLKQISIGDYVNIGQTIVNLQALDPMRVDFSVPQVYLAKLAVGQKVSITVDAYPKQTFHGTIYAFDSLLSTNTRSLDVRAKIANPNHKLLPGTYADVTAFIGPKTRVISVPQTALMYDSGGTYVYKVVANKAHKIKVKTAQRDTNNVIITAGLTAGTTVVTAGQLKLRDGATVMISKK